MYVISISIYDIGISTCDIDMWNPHVISSCQHMISAYQHTELWNQQNQNHQHINIKHKSRVFAAVRLTSTDNVIGPLMIHHISLLVLTQHLGETLRWAQSGPETLRWAQSGPETLRPLTLSQSHKWSASSCLVSEQEEMTDWRNTHPVFSYRILTTAHGTTNRNGVPKWNKNIKGRILNNKWAIVYSAYNSILANDFLPTLSRSLPQANELWPVQPITLILANELGPIHYETLPQPMSMYLFSRRLLVSTAVKRRVWRKMASTRSQKKLQATK